MTVGTHPTAATHPGGTVLTSPPQDAPIDRATEAARKLIDALQRTDRDNANLDRVAEELNSIVAHLEQHAPEVEERLIDMWNGEGVTRHDPVTGRENAIAPPVVLEGLEDGSVQGVVTLTLPYQGPPGHVHGGVSAMLLDHVLGVANAWGGTAGMTAQLSTRYHRPTPLFVPLTISGKFISKEGRKVHTVGEIRTPDGEVCVSVEGLFIDKTIPRPR
ncbi:PaaI family thioesterase [Rhodococcus globerulus]|uniref:Acyl-coenzyme A thioesterase THEM4 n=1 Tax=Rhodococcus globerulus TaxID=33008 RepID=A0ABU4C347_RHOGO|nr:PaaI family thioesterase [Rhodococcus globerulus]MDV6270922.1 PaaI family thioesterase [Rhodococcus globerulus]